MGVVYKAEATKLKHAVVHGARLTAEAGFLLTRRAHPGFRRSDTSTFTTHQLFLPIYDFVS